MIEHAMFACLLIGCSAANDTARDAPTRSVAVPTVASQVTEQPSKSAPTIAIAPEIADADGEPLSPETATVRSDGAVSWTFTPVLIAGVFAATFSILRPLDLTSH